VLKRVKADGPELDIHKKILSLKIATHHFIPILDILTLPDSDESFVIVLPKLHGIREPDFSNVYEVLECILQLTEGLACLHENSIAHNDIDLRNIGVLADDIYPKGRHFGNSSRYHPGDPAKSSALLKLAPFLPRTLGKLEYLFLDFGISSQSKKGVPNFRPGVYGTNTPPEMAKDSISNCYKVDIWCFGLSLQSLLSPSRVRAYAELHPLIMPWISKMLAEEPSERPSAQDSLLELRKLITSLSNDELRRTVEPKLIWSFTEKIHAAMAILNGQGDEQVLFAKLRGNETAVQKTFTDGSVKVKVELIGRVIKFLSNFERVRGNVLEWLASPKDLSKK